jgi:elongation factor Ts
MAITTEMIKKLRDQTGAGMMDCKKALEETKGDMNAAVEYLRKKGAAVAAKRADRQAKEGMVITRVSGDRKSALIVEVNCETDFVGRSEDFMGFAGVVADTLNANNPSTVEELLALNGPDGKLLSARLNDLLAKVGEKIDVRRFKKLKSADGLFSAYTHAGNKIGVLLETTGLTAEQAATGTGKSIAMQIAAMNPLVVRREEVEKSTIERELEIYRTQAKNEGKPQQILDKIANGKLEKFYQDTVLLEQSFIMDQGKTVGDVVKEAAAGATIKQFVRFELGVEMVA